MRSGDVKEQAELKLVKLKQQTNKQIRKKKPTNMIKERTKVITFLDKFDKIIWSR